MAGPNVSYHQNFDFDSGKIFDEKADAAIPRFFLEPGIKPVEMVEIIVPGDRLSRPVQRVRDDHRKRWPRAYEAFKAGLNPDVPGTPIARWDAMGWKIQTDMLGLGFQTVEQLAEAHDGQLANVPNGVFWRQKAKAFIDQKTAGLKKDHEIDELRNQIAELTALIKGGANVLPQSRSGDGGDSVQKSGGGNADSAPRRRRGRPPKAASVGAVSGETPVNQSAG